MYRPSLVPAARAHDPAAKPHPPSSVTIRNVRVHQRRRRERLNAQIADIPGRLGERAKSTLSCLSRDNARMGGKREQAVLA